MLVVGGIVQAGCPVGISHWTHCTKLVDGAFRFKSYVYPSVPSAWYQAPHHLVEVSCKAFLSACLHQLPMHVLCHVSTCSSWLYTCRRHFRHWHAKYHCWGHLLAVTKLQCPGSCCLAELWPHVLQLRHLQAQTQLGNRMFMEGGHGVARWRAAYAIDLGLPCACARAFHTHQAASSATPPAHKQQSVRAVPFAFLDSSRCCTRLQPTLCWMICSSSAVKLRSSNCLKMFSVLQASKHCVVVVF